MKYITTERGRTKHIQTHRAEEGQAKCGTFLFAVKAVRSKEDKAKPVCKRCASR